MSANPALAVADEAVCVALHIRPLIEPERDQGCAECLNVTPGSNQVGNGPHSFTYDHVFGGDCGQEPHQLYDRCVAPLVDGLFKGFNATVLAYGQTGSGKTFTMGSAFPQDPAALHPGVIPRAMAEIFERVGASQGVDFTVRVGFVEIHKEDIRDLLAPQAAQRGAGTGVHIRELPSGGIVLSGAAEREVRSRDEMARVLEDGTALRATAATGMNKHSSRSHAIFTITLEQRRAPRTPAAAPPAAPPPPRRAGTSDSSDGEDGEDGDDGGEEDDDGLDSYLCAKMHLVDLAGSERLKRTRAQGSTRAEGIQINKGLLCLGNVINALSEGKPHVPYRDSKLTRLLQDSLGGNSRTTMVACVSPADVNLEESLNTLRYAARARAIKNTPVVNRDPAAAQLAALRAQLAAARAENAELRRRLGLAPGAEVDSPCGAGAEELEAGRAKVAALERDNARLRGEAGDLEGELKDLTERLLVAQLQRDRVAQVLSGHAGEDAAAAALAAAGVPPDEATAEAAQARRLRELEAEVRRLTRVARASGAYAAQAQRALQQAAPGCDPLALLSTPRTEGAASEELGSPLGSPGPGGGGDSEVSSLLSGGDEGLDPGDAELLAQELAHRAEVARVQAEMEALQRRLESKEAAVAAVSGHAAMRTSYEAQLAEVLAERDALARERAELLDRLRSLAAASAEERGRAERAFRERLREVDAKVRAAALKERRVRELEATRARALEAVRDLERDVQGIRAQKVALQRQADRAAKEFGAWRREREREVMQLRKEGRASAAQLQRVQALHARQQDVLRRKTEEAAAARKRLKMLEDRRVRGRAGPAGGAPARAGSAGVTPRTADSGGGGGGEPLVSPKEGQGQANGGVPVPAEEGQRREWVEAELDACCSSYDLQRVLEGEKALRSEAARQLRNVERRLAAVRNPQWWGGGRAGGGGEVQVSEEALVRKRAKLAAAVDQHGRQIQEVSLSLVKARAGEEERGGGAADARRWAGTAAPPDARALLTTVFRAASQYKAQAYEAALAVTELSEEVEMLRLRLEVSEAEKLEAARTAGDAAAAAAAAAPARPPAASPSSSSAPVKDATDAQADALLEALNTLTAASAELADLPDGAGAASEEEEEEDWEEGLDDDDEETEDEADAWDPSRATPLVGGGARARRRAPASGGSGAAPPPATPREAAVWAHLNAGRAAAGEPPLPRVTVPALRAALKGRVVGGQEWRAGAKKRRELLEDYRSAVMGCDAAGPADSGSSVAALTPLGAAGSTPGYTPPGSGGGGGWPEHSARRSPFSQLKGLLSRPKAVASGKSTDSRGSPVVVSRMGQGPGPSPPSMQPLALSPTPPPPAAPAAAAATPSDADAEGEDEGITYVVSAAEEPARPAPPPLLASGNAANMRARQAGDGDGGEALQVAAANGGAGGTAAAQGKRRAWVPN